MGLKGHIESSRVVAVNDYYQWLSGKPKKLAAAFPAAQPTPATNVTQSNTEPVTMEVGAKAIEVHEGSATETFIGRVRDFWNRNK